MKLCNKFTFIFLCCLSIAVCNAGNVLARMFRTQEQIQRQLNACAALTPAALTPEQQNQLNSQLLNAAEAGDLPAVEQAIADGADIHAYDDAALRRAIEDGQLPAARFLVEHGANIHAGNDQALRYEVYKGHWIMAAYLLQHGADRTQLDHWQQQELENVLSCCAEVLVYILTELRTALSNNDWSMVERVLNIVPVQELPATIQEQIRQLIVAELRTALSKNDWSMVEQLLKLVSRQELPIQAEMQEQIEQLIVAAAEKVMPALPLNVQERILSFMMGPITWHYFIQQREKTIAQTTAE